MAIILDGRRIAQLLNKEIMDQVKQLRQDGVIPKLAVILAGCDAASVLYAKAKERACQKTGIGFQLFSLPENVSEGEMLDLILQINEDDKIHGVMVELPLPSGMNKTKVLESVSFLKDVDGVHPINRGLLLSNSDCLFPVTPQSCIEIIRQSGLNIAGKHAVLVGRGETVGKPLVFMMLNQNATVTVCHTKTTCLSYYTKQADIVIAAVGKPKMITKDMIKPGAIVVDAGINETTEGICGDVDFDQVCQIAGAISPVPGGVGSLTTALLQKNLLKAVQFRKSRFEKRKNI